MNRVLIYHSSKRSNGVIINVEEIKDIVYKKRLSNGLIEATIYGKREGIIAIIELRDLQELANLITLLGMDDYGYIYIEDGTVRIWTGTLKESKGDSQ